WSHEQSSSLWHGLRCSRSACETYCLIPISIDRIHLARIAGSTGTPVRGTAATAANLAERPRRPDTFLTPPFATTRPRGSAAQGREQHRPPDVYWRGPRTHGRMERHGDGNGMVFRAEYGRVCRRRDGRRHRQPDLAALHGPGDRDDDWPRSVRRARPG